MYEALEKVPYTLGESWVFFLILFCMAVLAYVHHMYPSRFQKLFKATFNERITRQVMREEMVFSHRASWLLLIVAALSFSLILTMCITHLDSESRGAVKIFFACFFGLSIWVFLRQLFRSVLGFLAEKDLGFREFNFVSGLIYKVLGLILLPLSALMAFSSIHVARYLGYVVILILAAAMIFRLFRGFKIGRYYSGSMYYMITYLCALELMPTLVVMRAILSNV